MAILLVCVGLTTTASSKAIVPDDQKALLTVQGQGVTPFAQISLSTGASQTIVTKADNSGQFIFSNLKYASFSNLKFSIDIPPYTKGLAKNYPANHLNFQYNVKESMARMNGQIGKYGTLALNLGGANDSLLRVAGAEGYVSLQTRSSQPMVSGKSILTASIVNAGEMCCPKLIVPATPITLTIFSQPVAAAPPAPIMPNQSRPAIPNIVTPAQPVVPTPEIPASTAPVQEKPSVKSPPFILLPPIDQGQPQEKPKIPYIVQGRIDVESPVIVSDDIVAATSFSSTDYDNTYVGGLKKISDEARNSIMLAIATMGSFLDARTFMDTTRSLQVSSVQTLRNYTTSDQVCRFGTLSKSLAGADAVARKNQLAISKIMMDRDTQKMNTIFSNPASGVRSVYNDFKKKYCSRADNNGFLEGYCVAATATSDQLYNRDVDFTRIFDVPLTIDADFSDSTMTNDKQSIIALFANLSKMPPVSDTSESQFDPRENSLKTQDARALNAMKTVSSNSFAALVAEKTKATSQSTTYMKDILLQLGLSATDATKLLGANPSYFAQMDVMTKKLFQNPAFYANLYDSEANVDRQRVAMKAVELQQDRDFLESLRRREMLLSVLLNTRLATSASKASESGTIR